MERDKPFYLSLTKENSHKVKITAGQGRFAIGTKGITMSKCDALVEREDTINWSVFNEFQVPAGGNWPRVMEYHGDDTSFIQWSATREMEQLDWVPLDCKEADFSQAAIRRLVVTIDYPIRLILGKGVKDISVRGKVSNLTLENYEHLETLSFSFANDTVSPLRLQVLKTTAHIKEINIHTKVNGQPFDCSSLVQFSNLTAISLSGHLCNLDVLSQLKGLERLELRYAPTLEGIPALNSWANLNYFIGWNIEETVGKQLKKQLTVLEKERTFQYASVSNLKKPEWFITEFSIPFGSWVGKNNKVTVKAYKEALKVIKKAKTKEEVKEAIRVLVEIVNDLPNIETTEREDTWDAVMQLVSFSTLAITEEEANQWFDKYRDF
ncbi:hypothetical protein [Myroides odoratimimus]|uniref:hypothetical protein n=1 Tax=Myroides odoratimimus TaxID=76832 RepID=UPI00257715B7|nr:hypothetical protein [Myroides odoratimimus]MDM1450186.1 hypothetical protein [Myroides odoratimimus]MEC4042160.1 hypothetical protein [Myroides odoratimimus]MEC4149899.1 hypothetical protein [Myroides odoratimimus]